MMPKKNDSITVWFSCGAASAVAAKLTVEAYGSMCRVNVVNNPVKQEDPDNRRFLLDVERWIEHPILEALNVKYLTGDCEQVWDDRKYMSGVNGAPCTVELKKKARQRYEEMYPLNSDWIVMGFTADERARHERFIKTERSNVLPVLLDAGITKTECFNILRKAGIQLPNAYRLGYPNANCIGCVKATSPTYWNHVRKVHPEVFADRAEQSRRLGCTLARYKGKRVFLDELPADAVGRPMKSLEMPECSIFCEEKP